MIETRTEELNGLPVLKFLEKEHEEFLGAVYPYSLESATELCEEAKKILKGERTSELRMDQESGSIVIDGNEVTIFNSFTEDEKYRFGYYKTSEILPILKKWVLVINQNTKLREKKRIN